MGLTRFLGVVLVLAALTASAQGQTSVTLAWDPSPGSDIAGYRLYEGGASRTYTNVLDVHMTTNGTFSALVSGATYFFAATAYNTNGLESDYSAEVSYTVPLPTTNPPAIALTSPANGSAYTAPATINLAASVTTNGHSITKVQFYNGAALLGTVATTPYNFSWTNVSAGSCGLTAQAVYDSGSTVASTAANVTVTNVPLPSIALTSPANGATYAAPATIPLAASVTANGHSISQVQFYNGATLLGGVASAPYTYSWNNVSAGTYGLSAKAVYDSGSTVASTAQNVTVTALTTNPPPPLPVVPVFVQQNYATPQSSQTQVAVAYPMAQTVGNANLLAIGWDDTTTSISAVSDSAGNLYQAAVPMYRGNGVSQAIYYSAGIKAGSNTVTVTFNQSAPYVDLRVTEYSGLAQANTVGGGSSGTGTGTSASSGTVTTTTTNELLFGAGYTLNTFTTAGAGLTSRVITLPDADIVEDMVASAPGSYAATAAATAGAWVMQVAAFNAAVASTNAVMNYAPVITVQPNGVTSSTAAGFTVSLTATGTPTLVYQWLLGGSKISGATTSSYTQSPATTTQSGNYTCVVTNSFGSVTSAVAAVLITNVPLPSIALTAPLNGASYTAPASISLAATVTANGHTITKVQFYNGAALIGQVTTAPYILTWTNVSAGSYGLSASLVYDTSSTLASSPVSITVTGLPAPWQTTDIGSVGVAGSASMSNGLYTVQGAGNLSGTADNFRLVYQPLTGDGEIKVRLKSVGNTGTNGRIGVMIRESLTSGSRYAWMGISPDGTYRWQRRSNTGGSTSTSTSTVGTPPNAWTRLVRTGNTLYGYNSTDGTNWTQVNSRSITMATNIYFGFVVASGSSNTLNTATFTNVIVVP